MKTFIKSAPIPLAGVMLACAALGNLLQSYSETARTVLGIIAGVLFLILLLKIILYPKMIAEDMKNPIMASVSATFSMGLMLLSTYLKPLIGNTAAMSIWFIAIALHVAIIIYFTISFIVNLAMPKVFASYFIVYVGIAVASITAPAYAMTGIGSIIFWFALIALAVFLALVTIRHIKYREVPEPAQPLVCIYAAPTSLCLAGYIQSVTPKQPAMVIGLLAVASVLYLISLVKMIGYLRLKFYPSCAAFTFPFVISAIAVKQATAFLGKQGFSVGFLQYIVLAETVIAAAFVLYTLVRFLIFMGSMAKQKPAAAPAGN